MKNTPNGDAELLAQLRESEHSALTEIYNKYWKYLYQSSFRILQDHEKCNDVIQEVFVNLWEIRSKLFIKLSLKSYLYAAVKYEVLRQLRKQVINDDILDFIDTLEDNSNEELMEYKELQQQIDQIIEELPPRCQEVFKLSRLEHLTHKEIAEKLAISTKTVEYHIANALVYLRSQLGKTLSIESNPNFSMNIDQEIDYFLTQAIESSQLVADGVALVNNTKDNVFNSSNNPYFKMFGDFDLNAYSEVLLWRQYSLPLNVTHAVNHYMNRNAGNSGYSKGLVENFTMANGLPIYAANSGYQGDDLIASVKAGRDNRLQIFMKAPGELSYNDRKNTNGQDILEGNPDILGIAETRYVTGYALKKGFSYLIAQSEGATSTTGSIVFRAVEAYLNYIEASYLKNGSVNAKAQAYWTQIRERAGVNPDYMNTVNNTDMNMEAKGDFGAYSAGQLLSDKVLYNIRRERRLELVAEGMRFADLKRWRALDQLAAKPYIVEGMKIWGPMQDWYKDEKGVSTLIPPNTPGKTGNVSLKSESNYLRPYRINLAATNLVLDGYKWISAHYLNPIAMSHFTITSPDGSPESSSIYQNPGWPLMANQGAK